jgi:hypothetical protein
VSEAAGDSRTSYGWTASAPPMPRQQSCLAEGRMPAGLDDGQESKPQAGGGRTVTGHRRRAICTQAFCCRCPVLRWSRYLVCRLWAGLRWLTVSWRLGISAPVSLKWPNDVLVDAPQGSGHPDRDDGSGDGLAAIIGCGVNLAHHPQDTRWPATHLAAHRRAVDPSAHADATGGLHGNPTGAVGLGRWSGVNHGRLDRNVHSVLAPACG